MPGPPLPVVASAHELYASLYDHPPSGWYFVGRSRDLPRRGVQSVALGGRELVLFRTEGGTPALTEPYCPHLGAHLGHGGCVQGETIACPFHEFRFGLDGRCVATPYGAPPPRARLEVVPLRETHGLLLGWLGAPGEAPWFEVPDVDVQGWGDVRIRRYRFRGHPQETTENSVDSGHFAVVHGYSDVHVRRALELDGAHLRVEYGMRRPRSRLLPGALGKVQAEFAIHVHGLGYSRVEVLVPELHLRLRHFVFATPVGGGEIDLTLGFALPSVRERAGLGRSRLGAPLGLVDRAATAFGLDLYRQDVEQDFEIWKHKRYVHPPQLAQGDGPIGAYRRWCKQFYPQLRGPNA